MKALIAVLLASVVLIAIITVTTQHIITNKPSPPKAGTVLVSLKGQGTIAGNWDSTLWTKQKFMQFRGIPYAESPKGEKRFQPPVPREPWYGVLDATKYGNRCPVITTVSKLSEAQLKDDLEDCLNLSVFTKDLSAKRPVMFYIYGGGFYNGSASDHPPHHLLEKDIVLVVVQYRIGALGWLSTLSPAMPGNAPVMDLQLALKWVQQHIHAFGGDSSQVTTFGQSAGAAMSGALLVSPTTPVHQFKGMIIQSGSIFATWALNKEPKEQVERICRALNCAACDTDVEQLSCLRKASVLQILEVTKAESFRPLVGDLNGILPEHPGVLLSKIKYQIPIMTGFTKHDGSFVLAEVYDGLKHAYGDLSKLTVRQFKNELFKLMINDNSGVSQQLLTGLLFQVDILDTNDHKGAIPSYFDICNVVNIKSPIINFIAQLVNGQYKASSYLYTFDYEGSNTRFGYELGNAHYPFNGGVHHSNDNIYLFSTHTLNEKDTKMAKTMVELWTSFAINGKPSVPEGPEILAVENESGPYFHINEQISNDLDVLQEITATVDDKENNLIRENIEF